MPSSGICERFRVKNVLVDSEERFRTFVEQSMGGILLVDEEGAIREWNQDLTIPGIMGERRPCRGCRS